MPLQIKAARCVPLHVHVLACSVVATALADSLAASAPLAAEKPDVTQAQGFLVVKTPSATQGFGSLANAGTQPSGCSFSPESCNTEEDLGAWREQQVSHVMKTVPSQFQRFPLEHIEQEFRAHLAKLRSSKGVSSAREAQAALPPGQRPPGQQPQEQQPSVAVADRGGPSDGGPRDCAAVTWNAIVGPPEAKTTVVLPLLLMTASMCRTGNDLDAWHACQIAEIMEEVPESYKRFAANRLESDFARRSAELQNPAQLRNGARRPSAEGDEAPVFLMVAEACKSDAELRAWRAHQLQAVERRLPPVHRDLAVGAVEGTFRRRFAELQQESKASVGEFVLPCLGCSEASSAHTGAGNAPASEVPGSRAESVVTASSAGGDGASSAGTSTAHPLLFVFLGLLIPSILACASSSLGLGNSRDKSHVYEEMCMMETAA